MIADTPEQLHLKEASELQSNVSGQAVNKHLCSVGCWLVFDLVQCVTKATSLALS